MNNLILKNINPVWYIVDAKYQILGRLASKLSIYLLGKNKKEYIYNFDKGDYIIVINANQIHFKGNKNKKYYYHHTGYPGGLRSIKLKQLLTKSPCYVIKHAVKGMLPKNLLGNLIFKKLKVYENAEHPHVSQQPKNLII
ncbi:50S ribosomal protein L13 [Candidatus Johnevansia muelleri]|uniref:Large ribosomal subunit protein uL13 n=1 Tax=Candidatus Johnevansia muelleri TaxID=1495769 RepID=A0A078KI66_9GAMM|nr:50S ribosomal protein L13 [Candidatus Evansia muelleri]